MSGDVRRRLDGIARRAAPPPDPDFADELETRLRAIAASLPPAAPEPPRRPAPARWRVALGVGALGAMALVAAFAVGVLTAPPAERPAPELAGPVNIEVSFADGTVLEDPDGLLLPEGAVITVGPGGSGRIGDIALEPGDIVTIRGGRAQVTRPSPVGMAPSASSSPRTTPATTARPTSSPSAGAARPTPTASAATVPPATSPGPSASPGPTGTVTPTPRPAATAGASLAPSPSATPATLRPQLRARLVSGPRIAVRWSATWGASSYLLLASLSRSGPATDPALPGARVLGEFVVPPDRALRFRVPDQVVEVKLRVVALRADGTVLRRSRVVTITIPSDTSGDGPSGPTSLPTPAPTSTTSPTPDASSAQAPTPDVSPTP